MILCFLCKEYRICVCFSGFLKSLFDTLYDEDIISEETFYVWENSNDSAESKGKGPALKSTTEFFRWLRSAAEESGDEN